MPSLQPREKQSLHRVNSGALTCLLMFECERTNVRESCQALAGNEFDDANHQARFALGVRRIIHPFEENRSLVDWCRAVWGAGERASQARLFG